MEKLDKSKQPSSGSGTSQTFALSKAEKLLAQGNKFFNGIDVEKNIAQALMCYVEAYAKGNAEARDALYAYSLSQNTLILPLQTASQSNPGSDSPSVVTSPISNTTALASSMQNHK